MSFGINAHAIKNRNIVIALLLGIVVLNILPTEIISPVLILLIGLVSGVFLILVFASEDFGFLFNYFAIAFGIRAFLSYLFYLTSFILGNNCSPGFLFPNDGWSYSQQGWQIFRLAEKGVKITMENFMTDPNLMGSHSSGNIATYDFFTSHVYSITGHSPLSLFFISSTAGALSGIFLYLLAKEIFSRRIAKIASLFAFFWPSFILWSTQHLKESIIIMLVGLTLWTALYAYRHVSAGFGILSALAMFLFFKVSAPICVITMGAILISFVLLFLHHLFKNKFVALVAGGIVIMAFLFVFQNQIFEIMLGKAGYATTSYNAIDVFKLLNYHRSARAQGNLQFMGKISISNPIKALLFVPIGFVYAVLAPFPWQVGSFNQIIAVPETLIFYIFIPATLRGVIFAYKRRFWPAIILLSISLTTLGFLALVEGNSGTLFRHRVPAFYLLFIFTAVGLAVRKKGKRLTGLIRDIK